MSAETVTIASLGAKGDGVVHGPNGPLFVPFALPGETVSIARVKNEGTIMSIANPSADRVEPPCKHFGPDGVGGICGGCSLQHMAKPAYNAFKRQELIDALKSKGIEAPVGEIFEAHPHQRRRLVFTVRRRDTGLVIGYMRDPSRCAGRGMSHRVGRADLPAGRAEDHRESRQFGALPDDRDRDDHRARYLA
jgi:23S rRNA (uracil1939-C5)-methyltransferase